MKKKELFKELGIRTGLTPYEVSSVVNNLITIIREETSNDETVCLRKFGTFHKKTHGCRERRNPLTGEKVMVDPCDKLVFKPSKTFYG